MGMRPMYFEDADLTGMGVIHRDREGFGYVEVQLGAGEKWHGARLVRREVGVLLEWVARTLQTPPDQRVPELAVGPPSGGLRAVRYRNAWVSFGVKRPGNAMVTPSVKLGAVQVMGMYEWLNGALA